MQNKEDGTGRDWQAIAIFVVAAYTISWSVNLGLRAMGVTFFARVALSMFGPAVAAMLVRGPLCGVGFADAGLRPNLRLSGRPYVGAYLAVPAALGLALILALLTHVQHFDPYANLLWLYHLYERSGTKPPTNHDAMLVLIFGGLSALTVAIPVNMVFAFGEEFGWRGFLLPRLSALTGEPIAVIIVGLIWGGWHLPLVLLDGYEYPFSPSLAVPMTLVLFMVLSTLIAPLRLRSGSIWPATIAHAALNAQAGLVFLALAPRNAFGGAPVGIIGIISFVIVAVALWRVLPLDVQA